MSPSGDPLIEFHSGAAHPSSPSDLYALPPGSRKLEWLAVVIAAFVFALYFGLAPLGQWQADEYDYFGHLRQGAWQAFVARMQWSPRPLGESVYLAYGLLANYFHRPLTGWFLGLLWIGFAVCACASACTVGNRQWRVSVMLVGLGLAASFLTSGPLFQVFYWPAGAVAYLPTLSATLLLFVQILYGRQWSRQGRLVCCVCLLVAALSSEIGAMFAVSFALLQIANALWFEERGAEAATGPDLRVWLFAGIIACAVLLASALHRLPVSETAFTVGSPQLHHTWASAVAAARSLALELVGLDSNTRHTWLAVPGVLSRLLIAIGVALLWTSSRSPESQHTDSATRRQLIVIGAAFLIASLASLFASYLHFGSPAGERYETLRRCWILMTYAAIAVLIAQSTRNSRIWKRSLPPIGSVLLIAGVLMSWHVSPLVRQYSSYGSMACTTSQNFESGLRPSAGMVFVLPPIDGVITPAELAPGVYTRNTQAGEFNYAGYMLEYFGKQSMVVLPNRPCDAGATGQPVP